jgi:hypothetical protein
MILQINSILSGHFERMKVFLRLEAYSAALQLNLTGSSTFLDLPVAAMMTSAGMTRPS